MHRITLKLLKHAVRGLASIELSFHPWNILRDSRRGVSRGNKNVAVIRKNGDFVIVVNYTIFAAIIDSFVSN